MGAAGDLADEHGVRMAWGERAIDAAPGGARHTLWRLWRGRQPQTSLKGEFFMLMLRLRAWAAFGAAVCSVYVLI